MRGHNNKPKKGENAPAPPTLDEEIRTIWQKPIQATPINKDLPRLASRIHVIFNESPILASVPADAEAEAKSTDKSVTTNTELNSRKLMNSVEYRMSVIFENNPEFAKALTLPPDVVSQQKQKPFAQPKKAEPKIDASGISVTLKAVDLKKDERKEDKAQEKKDTYVVWITRELNPEVIEKKRATELWTKWDGPGYLKLLLNEDKLTYSIELRMKNESLPFCTCHCSHLVEMIDSSRYFASRTKNLDREFWSGFAFHTRQEAQLFKDAVQVSSTSVTISPPPIAPTPEPEVEHESIKVIRPVQKVARHIDSKEVLTKFEGAFKTLQEQKAGDLEVFLPDLWKAAGEDCKTARVFKAIHQNIILVGVFHIKQNFPSVMTRDVRAVEGWQIYIHILPDAVVVTHARREQALATTSLEEYFWYEWHLRMIFDHSLTDMRAARLRIVNIGFGEKTSEAKKAEYNKIFGSGNIILY